MNKKSRTYSLMLSEFRQFWKYYVLQSFLAGVMFFLTTLVLSLHESIVVASVGATTFIVFAMPSSMVAKSKNIVGGHVVGLICGLLCSLLLRHVSIDIRVLTSLTYALAIGSSIFVMVVIDVEHPPASGTALAMAMRDMSMRVTIDLLLIVVILAAIHYFFKRYMRDLV